MYIHEIKKFIPSSKSALEEKSNELGKILDNISKREKKINSNLNEKVGEVVGGRCLSCRALSIKTKPRN